MSLPQVVSRDEWLAARTALLVREKEAVRAKDRLNTARRELPMVEIDKEYTFDGPDGPVRLLDLFEGRRQLVVQHVMYGPDWEAACPACTASVDEQSPGLYRHLNARETTYVLIARAPYAKFARYATEHGWTAPVYSSHGSDFNYDFNVTLDNAVTPPRYNYRDVPDEDGERPGLSCFLREGDRVFHTYSTFARGAEQADGSYGILDLTALGRQEEWELPKDRYEQPHANIPSFAE